MSDHPKPEDAQYWCPEHGDEALQGSCIEDQWVDLDRCGSVERVRDGSTEITKIWCVSCERILLDREEYHHTVWRLSESDIQSYAERELGRRITEEEMESAIKGLEYGLGEYYAEVVSLAVDNAVSGMRSRKK